MAKINSRLKSLFTSYNLLFSMVGLIILLLGLWNDSWQQTDTELIRELFLVSLYMVGSLTVIFSLLGAYGAHYEHRLALIMFLVSTVTGSIAMVTTGLSAAIARPQIVEQMEEMFKTALPLDRTSQRTKDAVYSMQNMLQCCGLFSYSDWQNQIPASCLCDLHQGEGRCTTVKHMSSDLITKTIYSQPCFPTMVSYLNLVSDYIVGVAFALAILAVLGTVLSSAMICRMPDVDVTKTTKTATVVLKVPAVFSPKPPKYQELFNTPSVFSPKPPKYQELFNTPSVFSPKPPKYQELFNTP